MADPRRRKMKRESSTSVRRIPVKTTEDSMDEGRKSEEEDTELQEMNGSEEPAGETSGDIRDDPEKDQLRERLARLQAEFDNYRKRQARDFRRLCSQGKRDLIQELLAVLDNYHRAELLVNEGDHSVEEIADGLMKTSRQLVSILEQEGLSDLGVQKDDDFDPNIHEAMLAEDVEGLDRDKVLEVFQKGYRIRDELLRPARVRVGKAVRKADAGPAEEDGGEQE